MLKIFGLPCLASASSNVSTQKAAVKCGIGADGADNAAGTSIRSDHRVFEIWCNAYDLDIGIDA